MLNATSTSARSVITLHGLWFQSGGTQTNGNPVMRRSCVAGSVTDDMQPVHLSIGRDDDAGAADVHGGAAGAGAERSGGGNAVWKSADDNECGGLF